jgi:hypothetical protein
MTITMLKTRRLDPTTGQVAQPPPSREALARIMAIKEEQAAKDRAQHDWNAYQNEPGWQKPFTATGDILSMFTRGATLGLEDKLVARLASMTGDSYPMELDKQRRAMEAVSNRSGWAGTAGEVLGGLKTMKSLPVRPGAGFLERTGIRAAEGAGYGGTYAYGSDTSIPMGVGFGAGFGAALANPRLTGLLGLGATAPFLGGDQRQW